MKKKNELRLVADLLSVISKQDALFLEQCRSVKHLALVDPSRAANEYREIAKQLLTTSEECTLYSEQCEPEMKRALIALEEKGIDLVLIEQLGDLRHAFMDNVIRPALSDYLKGNQTDLNALHTLYAALFKIDELITIAAFMRKVSSHGS